MKLSSIHNPKPTKHAPFHLNFIWCALLVAILGGFAMGAHVVFVIGFGYPPSKTLGPIIQAHGHLQLFGWTGLFIIAVSCHMLPRLVNGVPISRTRLQVMLWCILTSLLLRVLAHFLVFADDTDILARACMFLSGAFALIGITIYYFILIIAIRNHRPQQGALAAAGIRPFLVTTLLGWAIFAIGNLLLCLHFARENTLLLDQSWGSIVNAAFIELVVLPVCFAFSVNLFPIFLRLRAPTRSMPWIAVLYTTAAASKLIALGGDLMTGYSQWLFVARAAQILQGGAILWFIWELDLLRRNAPWFRKYRDEHDRANRPPRKQSADYGQFGRFDLFVYAAYICLAAGACADLLSGVFPLIGLTEPVPSDIIRHLYLLGFATQLILGMAVRMIPGFLGLNRIHSPLLVTISFVCVNFAVLSRIVPPLLWSLIEIPLLSKLWGLSGLFGMLAILCLALNLYATFRYSRTQQSS